MRLIDADALIVHIVKKYGRTEIILDIDEAPTVEAEPVVKCKDCKYCNGEYEYCYIDIFVKPDGYCSYGERREG